MRKILDSLLVNELFRDTRLHSTDIVIRLQLEHRAIDTMTGHLRTLPFPKETLRRSIHNLIDLGWAYPVKQTHTRARLIVPWMPLDVEHLVMEELERVRNDVAFVGEWLMKCILDLVVADLDFRDNVRPNWLVSGMGSGRLELDRWYKSARVAVEFNGTQHYQFEKALQNHEEEFHEQQLRDNLKAGLCVRQGIRYVEVSSRELDFDVIIEKFEGLLPLRPIQPDRPLIQVVANMCRSYVNAVHREERRSLSEMV